MQQDQDERLPESSAIDDDAISRSYSPTWNPLRISGIIIFVLTAGVYILLLHLADVRRRRLRQRADEIPSNTLSSPLPAIPEDVETWEEWPCQSRVPSIDTDSNDSGSSQDCNGTVSQQFMEIWNEWAGRSFISSSVDTSSDNNDESLGRVGAPEMDEEQGCIEQVPAEKENGLRSATTKPNCE